MVAGKVGTRNDQLLGLAGDVAEPANREGERIFCMHIGRAVETLDYIAMNIKNWDRTSRLGAYGAFGEIDRHLRAYVERKGLNTKTYEELSRFRWSLETLCGISSGNDKGDDLHRSWLLAAADALRADMCLRTVLDDPE